MGVGVWKEKKGFSSSRLDREERIEKERKLEGEGRGRRDEKKELFWLQKFG